MAPFCRSTWSLAHRSAYISMKLCCTVALANTSWAMASMRVARIAPFSRHAKSCVYSVSNFSRVSLLRMDLTDLTVLSTSDTSRLGFQPRGAGPAAQLPAAVALLPLEPPSAWSWALPWLLQVSVLRIGGAAGDAVAAGALEAGLRAGSWAGAASLHPLAARSLFRWPSKTIPRSANAEPAMVAPTHFTSEGGGARPAICRDTKSQRSSPVRSSASPTPPARPGPAPEASAATTTCSAPQPAAMSAPARAAPRG
mmetsp:Transcript_52005/g.137372  ORF Transcript_52005/g.137372 Transcript_52005/m.137372 type:complete len:254 (-) Transcript_52005:30-791(-)